MKTKITLAVAMAFPMVAVADGSPWLPVPGSTQVSLEYVNQSGDEFRAGSEKMTLPNKIKQDTTSLGLQYGLTDQLAIDAKLNYASSTFGDAKDSAFGDSGVGINWRVVDEFERSNMPTVTLRGAVIIDGNYSVGKVDAIGDGASGVELSVLAGKYLLPKLTVAGELGYRNRDNNVPADIWFSANVGYSINSVVGLSAGFTSTRSQGNLDIDGEGFTPDRFPEVREDRDLVKVGASFAVNPRTSLNVNYGEVVSGRNTTLATVWGASVATSF